MTDEEILQKTCEIREIIKNAEPEVLYKLATFMDLEGVSDEGMNSPCAYESADKADIYSDDGQPQKYILDLGLSLPSIRIEFDFQDTGTGYKIKSFKILEKVKY